MIAAGLSIHRDVAENAQIRATSGSLLKNVSPSWEQVDAHFHAALDHIDSSFNKENVKFTIPPKKNQQR